MEENNSQCHPCLMPDVQHFVQLPSGPEFVQVEENTNITLECVIMSKPKYTVVRWTHNQEEIWQQEQGKYAKRNNDRCWT